MPLRALIFDVDGTLAETEELHRKSFNQAFALAGLPWTWDRPLYGQLLEVAGGKERIAHFIENHRATPSLTRQAIQRLHESKTSIYSRAVSHGAVGLRPGVRRLLGEAQQLGISVAIATTTSRDSVNALLHASFGPTGLDRFAVIAAADSVSIKKPAPDVYDFVLKRLGDIGADTLAIEDTTNGLRSARAAGIDVLITRSIYGGEEGFANAVAVVDHLGDPDNPCRTLQGNGIPERLITVAVLRNLRCFSTLYPERRPRTPHGHT